MSDEQPLEFPFERSEYRHVLLARVGMWCVVERTWMGDGKPHLPHYEIVQLRREAAKTWPDGRVIAAHEAYPGPRVWGIAAWTEPTLVHARQRWEQIRSTPKGQNLPEWSSIGISDDREQYQAWKEGCLPWPTIPDPNKGAPA